MRKVCVCVCVYTIEIYLNHFIYLSIHMSPCVVFLSQTRSQWFYSFLNNEYKGDYRQGWVCVSRREQLPTLYSDGHVLFLQSSAVHSVSMWVKNDNVCDREMQSNIHTHAEHNLSLAFPVSSSLHMPCPYSMSILI